MLTRSAVLEGAARHVAARVLGGRAWSSVTYLVTLRCNVACPYCDFPRHAGSELGTADALRLLRGLRAGGTFRLGVSGGAPLLRADLPEILGAAASLGFVTSLVTNGILLRDRAREVSRVDYLLATIEGARATHDRVRGRGSWDLTVEGLGAVLRLPGPALGLICPLHAGNVDDIEEPIRLAEELGARVFFQPVEVRLGWAGEPFLGTLAAERVREAFARILAFKRSGRPVGNSRRYLEILTAREVEPLGERCPAGRFVVTVLPDGRVTPCCIPSFDTAERIRDLDHPSRTPVRGPGEWCRGCTISPYLENYLMFKPDPSVWLEALRWRRGRPS